MKYTIELKPKAEKDLKGLSALNRGRVVERLRWLEEDLHGDVKRLSNDTPEYRMRASTGCSSRLRKTGLSCIAFCIAERHTAELP